MLDLLQVHRVRERNMKPLISKLDTLIFVSGLPIAACGLVPLSERVSDHYNSAMANPFMIGVAMIAVGLTPSAIATIRVLIRLNRQIRSDERWRNGLCPDCGYDLRGTRSVVQCPECGWKRPESAQQAGEQHSDA